MRTSGTPRNSSWYGDVLRLVCWWSWTSVSSLASVFELGAMCWGAVQSVALRFRRSLPCLPFYGSLFRAGEFVISCNRLSLVQISAAWCSS